jgi:UDP-glucose 4-epimerase
MRILFTGGSSFTGLWFIRELAATGHEVVATFRQRADEYRDEGRRARVALALETCRGVFGCSFGDPQFLALLARQRWDLVCHHAAEVTNYKSSDFDTVAALASNTRNAAGVVAELAKNPARPRLLVTGSVFENDEGAGSDGLPAFSPYGLSKALSYQVFRYYTQSAGVALGKFVIPNPFGPHEEARFTAYLMRTWFAREPATVTSPEYVRDNIHVSLLAKAYAKFAADLSQGPGLFKLAPSGYAESQGAFTLRLAAAMRERLTLACEVKLLPQTEFAEPRVRINTDPVDALALGWDAPRAWDEFAAFYTARFCG